MRTVQAGQLDCGHSPTLGGLRSQHVRLIMFTTTLTCKQLVCDTPDISNLRTSLKVMIATLTHPCLNNYTSYSYAGT